MGSLGLIFYAYLFRNFPKRWARGPRCGGIAFSLAVGWLTVCWRWWPSPSSLSQECGGGGVRLVPRERSGRFEISWRARLAAFVSVFRECVHQAGGRLLLGTAGGPILSLALREKSSGGGYRALFSCRLHGSHVMVALVRGDALLACPLA